VRQEQAALRDARLRVLRGARGDRAAFNRASWWGGRNRHRRDAARAHEPDGDPPARRREHPNAFAPVLHTVRGALPARIEKRSGAQEFAAVDGRLARAGDAGGRRVDLKARAARGSARAPAPRKRVAVDRNIAVFFDRYADEPPRFVRAWANMPVGRGTLCLGASRSGARSLAALQNSSIRRSAC
jgi:hypothetical protein